VRRFFYAFLLAMLIFFVYPNKGNAMQVVGQGDAATCEERYIVKAGDTLRKIADRCGTTVSRLMLENPRIKNVDRIYVGQVITIPAQVDSPEPAEQRSVPVTGSVETSEPAGKPDSATAGEAGQTVIMDTYRVKPGDSLAKIARQLNSSLEALLLANPEITNPNRIYVNQELLVPDPSQLQALREERARLEEEAQRAVVEAIGLKNERWIDVSLASQKVRAYEGSELVRTFTVSTGTYRTPTVTGQYKIWIKLKSDDMRGPGYYLEDVPYVMYFYKGYGLHGTYWHNNFGTPMSHGCVNLSIEDARWLFEFAEVGTLVNVH
jgi:lipoprotein-anchoring transpeptidase ErfK/SrfK